MTQRLFAWANPVHSAPTLAEHTWVTTYPAPFSCTGGPPEDYWYCWGSCHNTGTATGARALRDAPGNHLLARCLATPNSTAKTPGNPALGGIDLYLIDGVCHQVANRVLYASGTGTTAPMTVDGARGYEASVLVYDVYGTNAAEWRRRRTRCGAAAPPGGGGEHRTGFRTLVARRLGDQLSPDVEREIITLELYLARQRRDIAQDLRTGEIRGRAGARLLNDALNEALTRLAEVLGPDTYERVMHLFPGERLDVADPRIAERCDYERAAAKETSPAIGRPATVGTLRTVSAKKSAAKRAGRATRGKLPAAKQTRKGSVKPKGKRKLTVKSRRSKRPSKTGRSRPTKPSGKRK